MKDYSIKTTREATPGNNRPCWGFTLVELLVVIAIIGILIALLLPAVQAAREAARRAQCSNNLKQIGLALINYESAFKMFPPGRTGCDGHETLCSEIEQRVGTSGLVAILPYMEQQATYDRFDFTDGPWGYTTTWYAKNRDAVAQVVTAYRCPSSDAEPYSEHPAVGTAYNIGDGKAAVGDYAFCSGTLSVHSGDYKYSNDGVFYYLTAHKVRDISDGLKCTLFAGEVLEPHAWNSSNIWSRALRFMDCLRSTNNPLNTLPGEGIVNDDYGYAVNAAFGSKHPGGSQFVFGDGHVSFLSENIDWTIYQYLATRSGGEPISGVDY